MNRGYIYRRLVVPDIVEWERPLQRTPALYEGASVRQHFAPHFDGLFRIGFSLKYREPLGAKIAVSLRESNGDRELFREVVPLKKFSQNRMRRFSFSPLWDSAGKNYYLNISAIDVSPETELRLLFDSRPFFHMKTGGELYFGNSELPGELSMVTECRVRVSKSNFFSFLHNFLDDKGFAIFYIVVVMIGFIGLRYPFL